MQEQCNVKWEALLKVFHNIIITSPDAKERYGQLKDLAKNDVDMMPRQKEGIIDRCDNAINGVYGKTKKPEDYSQQHNFSSNGKQ